MVDRLGMAGEACQVARLRPALGIAAERVAKQNWLAFLRCACRKALA